MTEYRASFDADVTFSNGGDLAMHGFRVDVPSADISPAGIAARARRAPAPVWSSSAI
jgi:arylformamidase